MNKDFPGFLFPLIKNEADEKEETEKNDESDENEEDETSERYEVTFSFNQSEHHSDETFLSKNTNKLDFKYPILLDFNETQRERVTSLTQNFNHVAKKLHPKSILLPLVDKHDAELSKKK